MAVARENPSDGLVEMASGLLVPGSAVRVEPKPNQQNLAQAVGRGVEHRNRATAYDTDGRRRVGLTRDEAKAVDKAVAILNRNGVGVLLACSDRFDGREHCAGWLTPEGRRRAGDLDAGFGCKCTRIHFLEV